MSAPRVVVVEDGAGGWRIDEEATRAQRERLREERRQHSTPTRAWWAMERLRILAKDVPEPIADMFNSATSFAGYARHYTDFWQLPADFTW